MCGGGKPKAPDTSAQDAEAARQRKVEEERYNQQRVDEMSRYEQQQSAQLHEARRQEAATAAQQERSLQQERELAETSQNESRRQAEAAASERAAQEEAARVRAGNMQAYSTGRSQRIDQVTGDINNAYAGFDDNYFNNFAKDFTNYYKPQLNEQYGDARKKIAYNFDNKGGLNSSAAIEAFGKLDEERGRQENKLANDAIDNSTSFRSSIDESRRTLLGEALSGTNIGPEVLPDGIEDYNGSLSGISGRLAPYTQTALTRVAQVKKPTFNSLGDLFSNLTSFGSSGSGGTTITGGGSAGSSLYQPKTSQPVRIVA